VSCSTRTRARRAFRLADRPLATTRKEKGAETSPPFALRRTPVSDRAHIDRARGNRFQLRKHNVLLGEANSAIARLVPMSPAHLAKKQRRISPFAPAFAKEWIYSSLRGSRPVSVLRRTTYEPASSPPRLKRRVSPDRLALKQAESRAREGARLSRTRLKVTTACSRRRCFGRGHRRAGTHHCSMWLSPCRMSGTA
jgi:hypothetical protein